MTKQPFSAAVLAFAAAVTLAACAAPGPRNSSTGSSRGSVPAAAAAAPAKDMKATYGNYGRVMRDGQTLYCKKESDTATRMVQETCLTPEQMLAQQENARNFMQGAQGIANTPPTSPNVR